MKKIQMSESYLVAILLALSGGFLDIYSYTLRGNTFSSMQTGNLILFSFNLFQGKFDILITYVFPIISFLIGICVVSVIEHFFKDNKKIHYRTYLLIIIILMMIGVSFIPVGNLNILANALLSFSAGIQLEAFTKFMGVNYASTMCTGNLRSFGVNLSKFFLDKNKECGINALKYLVVILAFIIGVVLGSGLINLFSSYAIAFISIFYLIIIILLQVENHKLRKEIKDLA